MGSNYTVPGLDAEATKRLVETLQERLYSLLDLQLTLKHIHWNVIGSNFIAVHEMLDPHVEAVRGMADELAERIATLGGVPQGTPGALVRERAWDDYDLGRASTQEHLAALDQVYTGIIADHRHAVADFEDLDLVTQDMLIGQLRKLEMYQWFARAHLETPGGEVPSSAARTERGAAEAVGHRP